MDLSRLLVKELDNSKKRIEYRVIIKILSLLIQCLALTSK